VATTTWHRAAVRTARRRSQAKILPTDSFALETLILMRCYRNGRRLGGISLGIAAALAGIGRTPAADAVPERVLRDFPLIRQPDPISCGPACAAMVLRYYGAAVDDAVAHPLRLRARFRLMAPAGLAAALSDRGVVARVQRGDRDRVVEVLDQGRPPILLVRISPSMWHYVVATGYQGRGRRFRLADPYGEVYWVDAQDLERSWAFDGTLKGGRLEDLPCGVCAGRPRPRPRPCAYCADTGKAPDTARTVVEAMELTPHLMIVPDQPPSEGPGTRDQGPAQAGTLLVPGPWSLVPF
jgi:Peptidase C39 family